MVEMTLSDLKWLCFLS